MGWFKENLQLTFLLLSVVLILTVIVRFRNSRAKKEHLLFFLLLIFFTLRAVLYSSCPLRVSFSFLFLWAVGAYLLYIQAVKRIALWTGTIVTFVLIIFVLVFLGYHSTLLFRLFFIIAFGGLSLVPFILLGRYFNQTREYIFLYFLVVGIMWVFSTLFEVLSFPFATTVKYVFFVSSFLLLGGLYYLVVETDYLRGRGIHGFSVKIGEERERTNEVYSRLIQTENTLLLQDRLIAAGVLAAGAVHEFKNILGLIGNSAEYGLNAGETREKDRAFRVIQEHVKTGLDSSSAVLEKLALNGREEAKMISLRDDLKLLYKMIRVTYRTEGINFIVDFDSDVKIFARQGEIEQALLNLIRNSAAAFRKIEGKEKWIKLEAKREDGSVIIEISDNAGGLEGEVLLNLFEPVRVEGEREGGLGLFFTRELLQRNGGEIEYTKIEEGSLFRITFLQAEEGHGG